MAAEPDRRSGDYVLWADTAASLQRLALGLGIAALTGLVLGLAIGLLPVAGAGFGTLVAVLSMIPPMAVLPILFIVFGLGELSKVMLIIIGVTPTLVRDLSLEVAAMPREQLIKAQTLGASTWQVAIRVVLPQIMPRLIKCVRLMIGPAFLFLISAEAIASDVGLGYRIFLVRRYLSMDVILPYVAWITLLAFLFDLLLVWIGRRGIPVGLCGGGRTDERPVFPQCLGRIRQPDRARTHQHRDCVGDVPLDRRSVRRGQEHLPAPDPRPGASDAKARCCSTASRFPPNPAPTGASCSSAIRCFRI